VYRRSPGIRRPDRHPASQVGHAVPVDSAVQGGQLDCTVLGASEQTGPGAEQDWDNMEPELVDDARD